MAFEYNKLSKAGGSYNSVSVNDAAVLWAYTNTSDTLADIEASGYFSNDNLNVGSQLRVNDYIFAAGSDGSKMLLVTGLSPITVSESSSSAATVTHFRAEVTTTGGSATEIFGAGGISPSDAVFVQMKTLGAAPVTVLRASAGNADFTVEFSADPSTDHVFSVIAYKA